MLEIACFLAAEAAERQELDEGNMPAQETRNWAIANSIEQSLCSQMVSAAVRQEEEQEVRRSRLVYPYGEQQVRLADQ